MAYIAPDSTIIFCKDVPLDNTYEHTIYFESASQQIAYFRSKGFTIANNTTYVRVNRGKVRVGINPDLLQQANYMCFQNSAFGTKWFYAFVTQTEYLNNTTCEVTFEIDSIQTYWFNADGTKCTKLLKCMVERNHTVTDVAGDNLVPEPLSVSNLIPQVKYSRYWNASDYKLLILVKPAQIGQLIPSTAKTVQKEANQVIPQGRMFDFNTEADIIEINSWIIREELTNFEISNAYLIPLELFTVNPIDMELYNHHILRPNAYYKTNGDIYQPKNQKLFTYPYTKMLATTPQGNAEEYLWEYSRDDGRIHLSLFVNGYNNPSCELRLEQYVGCGYTGGVERFSRLNTLAIDTFPQVQLAQYTSLSAANLLQVGTQVAALLATAKSPETGAFNPTISGTAGIVNTVGSVAFDNPRHNSGTTDNNLDLKYETLGFTFYVMGVKGEDAEIIDDFFDKYGYAIMKLQEPNIHSRPHWTYVKTNGCCIQSSAPAEDVRKICQAFDNGITWWANGDEVGDYSLDNRPA